MSDSEFRSGSTLLRIALGVAGAWGNTVVGIVVQIVQMPLFYQYLDREVLGAWMLFSSIAGFVMLWDIGLGTTFARSLAYTVTGAGRSRTDADGSIRTGGSPRDMVRTVSLAYWLLAALLCAAALPGGLAYMDRLSFTSGAARSVATAWMTYALGCAVHVGGVTPLQVLAGLGDVGLERGVRAAANLLGLAMNAVVLFLGGGINALAWVFVARGLAMWIVAGAIVRLRYPWLCGRGGRFAWTYLRDLRGDSVRIFVTRLGAFLILQVPGLVIARVLGPAHVPDYLALWMVVQMGITASLALGDAVIPHAASAFASGEREMFLRLHRNAVRLGLVLIGLWCTLFGLWAPDAMRLWLGPGRFLGYATLAPMLVTGVLEAHHGFNSHFVWAAGRWPFAPVAVLAGVLNVLLGIWWVKAAGEPGMAWATCVSQLLTNNWFVVYYAIRLFQLRRGEYLLRVGLPSAAIVAASASAGVAVAAVVVGIVPVAGEFHGAPVRSLMSILLGTGAAAACAGLLFWRVGLDAKGRHAVRLEVRKLLLRGA